LKLLTIALLALLAGCSRVSKDDYSRIVSENAALVNENAALVSNQEQSNAELTSLRNQLMTGQQILLGEEQRVECLVRLIETERTCDALTRDEEDAAARNQAVLRCMASRRFRNGVADCS